MRLPDWHSPTLLRNVVCYGLGISGNEAKALTHQPEVDLGNVGVRKFVVLCEAVVKSPRNKGGGGENIEFRWGPRN